MYFQDFLYNLKVRAILLDVAGSFAPKKLHYNLNLISLINT